MSGEGYASRNWYKVRSADLSCNKHPNPAKSLVKAFSKHTHISERSSSDILDRLLHLAHCLGEPETLTLYRLQPGKNQSVQPKIDVNG